MRLGRVTVMWAFSGAADRPRTGWRAMATGLFRLASGLIVALSLAIAPAVAETPAAPVQRVNAVLL